MKNNEGTPTQPVEDEDDLVSPAQVAARKRLAEAGIKTLLDDGTTDETPETLEADED